MKFDNNTLYNIQSNLIGKRYSLFDLAQWKNGLAFKKINFSKNGVPVIKIAELNNGISKNTSYTQQIFSNDVHLTKGDLLFSWSGNPQTSIDIFRFKLEEGWLNQHIFKVTPNENIVDIDYFYFLMKNLKPYFTQIATNKQTTGLGHVTISDIKRISVIIPNITIQKAIVAILKPIDNKIELNNNINNNILEQIKTICASYLNDFSHFGGTMPSDWVDTPLSNIADFISGYSYKGNELVKSPIAMATIKNFDRKGGFKLDGYKEILPSNKLKPAQHADLFDILIAHTDLTQNAEVIGNAEMIMSKSGYSDIVFSMDLVKVLPKPNKLSKFLLIAILQDKKFKAHCLGYINGTTVLHLSKKALPEYSLFLPANMKILKPLDETVTVMYKQISQHIEENQRLTFLRDTLLPKLISGELNISNINF